MSELPASLRERLEAEAGNYSRTSAETPTIGNSFIRGAQVLFARLLSEAPEWPERRKTLMVVEIEFGDYENGMDDEYDRLLPLFCTMSASLQAARARIEELERNKTHGFAAYDNQLCESLVRIADLESKLEQVTADAESDYAGMREFQLKFIACDRQRIDLESKLNKAVVLGVDTMAERDELLEMSAHINSTPLARLRVERDALAAQLVEAEILLREIVTNTSGNDALVSIAARARKLLEGES